MKTNCSKTKIVEFLYKDNCIQLNGLFTSKDKSKHPEVLQIGTHTTLDGID